jgi:hypothetical protein
METIMRLEKLAHWLTIAGNLGLLIGLALVIVQINQNSDLVREQLFQSRWTDRFDWYIAVMGENPAQALQKAVEAPSELTYSEFVVIRAYMLHNVEYQMRIKAMGASGMFDPDWWRMPYDRDHPAYTEGVLAEVFGNKIATTMRDEGQIRYADPEFTDLLYQGLNRLSGAEMQDDFLRIMERLKLAQGTDNGS